MKKNNRFWGIRLNYIIYFLKAFWSFIAVILGGCLLFLDSIVSSIKSTPHPSLVYTIFFFLIVGVLISGWTLVKLFIYDSFARKWSASDEADYATLAQKLAPGMPYKDAFSLLVDYVYSPLKHHRNELQRQIEHAEKEIGERLSFPGFIAGALVGIGLVGTFIGLLGALDDLGKLFAALTGGSENSDPTAMFSAMLVQLQAPMKSMGTAFVASLYGLLGSLILGAVVLSVNKTATTLLGRVHDTIFDTFDKLSSEHEDSWNMNYKMPLESTESNQLKKMKDELLQRFSSATEELSEVTKAMTSTSQALKERNHIDKKFTTVLSSGAHWVDSWQQINEQLTSLRAELQMQNTQLLMSNNEIVNSVSVVGERIATLNKLMLDKMEKPNENFNRTEGEVALILDSLNACRFSFEDVSSKLRSIISLSVDKG